MLIHRLKVSGLLSFGPDGIDLELEDLNVLIGPNGSGKSNLIEVLSLLRASPTNLPQPVKEMGGVREWLWKGKESTGVATIEATVRNPQGRMPVRHALKITEHGERFEVVDERIENESPRPGQPDTYFYYRFQDGNPVLNDFKQQRLQLQRENIKPEESILSQVRDPERYPVLSWLQEQYQRIRIYRNWAFGPMAEWRREQSAHSRADVLTEGGENLALVLSKIRPRVKLDLLASLQKLYDGINDVHLTVDGGNVLLFLEETDGREIPATRLSDGTLRYLSLLAILLHPDPPPLIAIEEPELGLHPDVLPHIAELLVRASQRTQLIVTTHSRMLVDALTDQPSSVLVCSKERGESQISRLSQPELRDWLEKYTLGDLWSKGEIGGNRW
jgi:predicted ATPase